MTSNRAMRRVTGTSRARPGFGEQIIDARRSHKGSVALYPNFRSCSGRREGVIGRCNIRYRRFADVRLTKAQSPLCADIVEKVGICRVGTDFAQ